MTDEDTGYLNRSDVRGALIAQPDENLGVTEGVLAEIDQLPIASAGDIIATQIQAWFRIATSRDCAATFGNYFR